MNLVEYTVDGAVALVTLQRPPVNALSAALVGEIDSALLQATDPAIRAVVVTGTPHFAAGADITEFQAAFERGHEDLLAADLGALIRRFEQLGKPTIAAVVGYALGGGLELAMGADFRYVGEGARLGQPEIKLGIIPGGGGTQRLARLVGLPRARELVLSGRQIDAAEAVAIGLADRVLPDADVVTAALEDAARWAEGPTVAYGAAKRVMVDGYGRPIDEALAAESDAFREVFGTADAREGVAAFLAKRTARFQGR